MNVRLGLVLTIVASLLVPSAAHSEGVALALDPSRGMEGTLPFCATDVQLDCVELPILVRHGDGTTSTADVVSSKLPDAVTIDGDVVQRGSYQLSVHSGTATGPRQVITFTAQLSTPERLVIPAVNMRWGKLQVDLWGSAPPSAFRCRYPYVKVCNQFTIDPNDTFEIKVRTSWLKAQDNEAQAARGDITGEAIPGGTRWTLIGGQVLLADFGSQDDVTAEINGTRLTTASALRSALIWRLHAVGPPGKSAFEATARCADAGVTFRSSNSSAAGQTGWDAANQQLYFNIFAPHYDPNGDPFHGFFRARLPRKWLDCAYPGNTLSQSLQVIVSIIYGDGETQLSITYPSRDMDIIVDIPDYHFSAPKIAVKDVKFATTAELNAIGPLQPPTSGGAATSNSQPADASTPQPTVSPTPTQSATPKATASGRPAASKTIKCVKGKQTKRVRGTSPKCPVGWKKS